ncbi:hypothetical protein Tco_0852221 [Tanacetum coccineum]
MCRKFVKKEFSPTPFMKMNQHQLELNLNLNIKVKGKEYDVISRYLRWLGINFKQMLQCTCGGVANSRTCADTDKTNSVGDIEILQIGEEQGKDVANVIDQEEKTAELNEGQVGSNPGKTPESRPPPDDDKMGRRPADKDPREACGSSDEHVILEDPLSSSGTLSSIKNLDNAYTIGDQFLNDKSTEDEPGKLNIEAEVVSMVTVPIYQVAKDSAARVTALEKKFSDFEHKSNTLDNTTQNLGSRVFTLELQDLPHKINQTVNEVVKEAVHVALQAPLRDCFRELPKADMKEILHQRMFESGTYRSLPKHVALYEAPEASMERANRDEFLAKKDKSRKRRRNDQDPPPLPDLDMSKKKRHDYDASEAPSSSSKQKSAPHSEQPIDDVPIPDDVNILDSEDTDTAHLPKIKSRPDWLKPAPEEDRPATPKPDWFHMEECHLLLTDQVDLVNPEGHRVVPDVSKPLPLGGSPGSKERRSALSISKLKAANYPDFGLEELVSSLWIESEHEYDISAAYGISHWWFKHKEFYITRHSAPSDRSTVRSHMRILSVVSLKTYERYEYTFLKEIVLRRVDYKEYKISETNFKNLHPNDFKNLYQLHLQGQLNHLSGTDKVHLFNVVNLDGALNRILDKLDHMVKDFKLFKFNRGMEIRIWFEDDRRKSKEFMKEIERRLKIRRIFRSLESFIGGRLRDVDYRLI